GDMAGFARDAWTDLTAGENQVVNEALRRKVEQLRQELLGDSPTPLEKLLVERVTVCWLQVYYLDAIYARQTKQNGGMSWVADLGHQRRQDRAHRRYLTSLRTLAQVKRLLVPSIQVNIAEQQIVSPVMMDDPKPDGARS